jgi:4'-phosphopantetheinyl transferase EntD
MMLTTSVDNPLARMPRQLEATAVENELRATVMHALKSCHGGLQLDKNAFLAVRSAADQRSHPLHPEEEQVLSPRACPKKRTEFALGRAAVREPLRELGEGSFPVLRGGQGEPVWPQGIMGSITHCWPWAVALVVRSQRQFAIGIDLENLERARRVDISGLICSGPELEWARSRFDFHESVAMIFSAKETVYKGFYRFWRRYIDFKEVELSWFPERQLFRVALLGRTRNEFPSVRGCEVHCRPLNGLIFSCLVHGPAKEAAAR